jgi:hypothetical protein
MLSGPFLSRPPVQQRHSASWDRAGEGRGPNPCHRTIGLCMLCHPALGYSNQRIAGWPFIAAAGQSRVNAAWAVVSTQRSGLPRGSQVGAITIESAVCRARLGAQAFFRTLWHNHDSERFWTDAYRRQPRTHDLGPGLPAWPLKATAIGTRDKTSNHRDRNTLISCRQSLVAERTYLEPSGPSRWRMQHGASS